MKKTLLSLLIVFALARIGSAASAGGGIATKIPSPVSFEFWHALNGENEAALRAIIDDFNARQNGLITVKPVYQGHYKELFSKLTGAAKAGNLPTMSMIFANRLTAYVLSGLAEDLTPYIENKTIGFAKDVWENIPPSCGTTACGTANIIPSRSTRPPTCCFTTKVCLKNAA